MDSKIFVLVYFLSGLIFSQTQNESKIDSLRIEQKYHRLLNKDIDFNIPLYSLGEITDPYELAFETGHFDNASLSLNQLNSFAMSRIKSDINQSLAIYRQGQNKYHLGVVSDVLGYVSTAAAAGLAVYHLYKYRKKYGIK